MMWMNLAASRGSNPEGSQFRVPRMSGMKAPAIMQAMPSSRLLMLTVISFPDPGGRGWHLMRLRQFCGFSSSEGPGWALAPPDALGMELEGHWCQYATDWTEVKPGGD